MTRVHRVFGLTLDEEDDDREGDHTSVDDDESLSDNADNPTNLFSSATGQCTLIIIIIFYSFIYLLLLL